MKSIELLHQGIYFDNTGIYIPWETSFDELAAIGSPAVSPLANSTNSDIYEQISWKAVDFLGLSFSTFTTGRTIYLSQTNLDTNAIRFRGELYWWEKFDENCKLLSSRLKLYSENNNIEFKSSLSKESATWNLQDIHVSIEENGKTQAHEFTICKLV